MVFLSIVLLRVCKGDLGFVRAGKYGLCKCIANVSFRYSNPIYGSIIIDRNMNVTWEERELGNNFCNAPTLGTPFCIRCGWTKPYMMDGE